MFNEYRLPCVFVIINLTYQEHNGLYQSQILWSHSTVVNIATPVQLT